MSTSTAAIHNPYAITLEPSGILSFHVQKVWNAQEADDFFAELAPTHAMARRRHGRVLALAQVSAVQFPTVVLRVRSLSLAIKQPGDQNALLVATMMSKLQMGRLGTNSSFGVFTNEEQARAWLLGS